MASSASRSAARVSHDVIGEPTEFGAMLGVTSGVVIWLVVLIGQGVMAGLKVIPLLLIALAMGAATGLIRLRLGPDHLAITVGPWRRAANLGALASISWKMTGGGLSRGTIFVRDRMGGRAPIYVGRFTRIEEWGPLLLDAAARCGATVDDESRRLLEGAGAPRKWRGRG
jgi:hypothetical protein